MFGLYRTVLAGMVVAQHLGGVPNVGAYAVFGFYTLSGYLMTLIMQENYGYSLKGAWKYGLNRFLRIYPIYWFSIVFMAVIILFVGEGFSTAYNERAYLPGNMGEVVRNICLFFPLREAPRLTPPSWALTVELFYYICIGLGLSRNGKIAIGWFVAGVLYHAAVNYYGLEWEYRYFYIPAASLPFSTGALIYHYKDRIKRLAGSEAVQRMPAILGGLMLANWLAGLLAGDLRGIFFYVNYVINALLVVFLSHAKPTPAVPVTGEMVGPQRIQNI